MLPPGVDPNQQSAHLGGDALIWAAPPDKINIRISGSPTGSAYPWSESYWTGSAWADVSSGRSGTATVIPARERNGVTTVATNTIVSADVDLFRGELHFDAPSSAASLTVKESDNNPSVSSVTTISFDIAYGYVVVDSGSGVATIRNTDRLSWVRLHNTTAQSITNNTQTALTWDTEQFDTDSYSSGSPSSGITLPASSSAAFLFGANIRWAANATGIRQVLLTSSLGAVYTAISQDAAATGETGQCLVHMMGLVASDTVKIQVLQTSGGNLNVENTSKFWMAPVDLNWRI